MKIIKYYRKAGLLIRLSRRCVSIGIVLSLWISTTIMLDIFSDVSKLGDSEKGRHLSDLRSLSIQRNLYNSSSVLEPNSAEGKIATENGLEVQALYRGALRKIESVGLGEGRVNSLHDENFKEKVVNEESISLNERRIFVSQNELNRKHKDALANHKPGKSLTIKANIGRLQCNESFRCENDVKTASGAEKVAPKGQISASFAESSDTNLEYYEKYLNKEKLKKLERDGFLGYSYNVTASDGIGIIRTLPDTRPASCPRIPLAGLPTATVIICFHNEAMSVLLRTVNSVIERSPSSLLEEVIIVDDNSTKGDLGVLERELKKWPKVSFLRTPGRQGLVRARLLGASYAKGELLVFLDSHCECNMGWLPPLLSAVHRDRTKIVSPYIDAIQSESFDYIAAPDNLHGGFTWRMEFIWKGIPPKVMASRSSPEQPIRTPAISGGLFAIDKDYFMKIGAYDEDLNIWGGENLELAFRTWMCGGSLEINPCSRVGHVFRNILPYKFPTDSRRTILRNLGRVAEVWMDDYKEFFFAAVDFPNDLHLGDLSKRRKLRRDLNCRSFQWYLDNIIPELNVPPKAVLLYGEFRNIASLTCLTASLDKSGSNQTQLDLNGCLGQADAQLFYLMDNGYLHHGNKCVVAGDNKVVGLGPCGSHTWVENAHHLNLVGTDLCLTSKDNEFVTLSECQKDAKTQQWDVSYNFKWRRKRS